MKAESKTKEFILFFAEANLTFINPKEDKGNANREQNKRKTIFFINMLFYFYSKAVNTSKEIVFLKIKKIRFRNLLII
ncbi:MAG: hypothetical protein IJK21_07940 [Prevotella sp.]|nr:hypothetical protein [Prevotella sp.]